ncbi:MAG: chymotrypsin [Solirubrobacteraceae bacterium]|nr:chymotrypsin [Solirubrobacteraceae bacterium]
MRCKRHAVCALLCAVAACAAATPAGAVVGGTEVAPESVPWFVSFGGCGGTLVAADRVLTAAHCVAGRSPAELTRLAVGGVRRDATRLALFPNWRQRNGTANYLDDVALIKLDAPVLGVPLVAIGGPAVSEAQVLGRGRRFAPGTRHTDAQAFDGTLRAAPLRTIGDANCARRLKGYVGSTRERFRSRMLCAIDADGRAPLYSGCNGDSGGPLWTGSANAPIQLGVVSWGGDRCGADHLPTVFADVARYRDFIADPSPTWAPTRTGGVTRITGTARAGRTLSCAISRYVPQRGTRVGYAWAAIATGRNGSRRPRLVGRGRTYRVARADRDHSLTCVVTASNDGGFVTVDAATRVVRR